MATVVAAVSASILQNRLWDTWMTFYTLRGINRIRVELLIADTAHSVAGMFMG